MSLQRAVLFVMWCLAEGSALQQRSDTDLCPRLWDILVLVPYLCSHFGCSSQCFPWLPFLFAFPGREFSGPRAWFSLVFVLCLGCHSCKQSQRVINHRRIEPHPFPTKVTGRPMPMRTQEGSGYVPPGRLPSRKLQHPTLTLILRVLFCL